jgi:molybdopterin converting factor subunit 1
MGRAKLLLPLGGATVIEGVVTALRRGGTDRVIVVAPPADAPEGPAIAAAAARAGAEVLSPETRPAEMRLSVELGLAVLENGPPPWFVILCPGDAPGMTPNLVARLLGLAARRRDCIVIPCHEGRRGHPIVLTWDVATEVRTLPPDVGVNALVARHADRVVELPVPDPELIADLDTPEDLDRWSRRPSRHDRDTEESHSETLALDQAPRSMDTMHVSVRLFALAKERAQRSELELEVPAAATVADLRAALREQLPELAALWSRALIAVNEEYAEDDAIITAGAELAVIPPVSGGTRFGSGMCVESLPIWESNQR